ncbi:NAD(P)/FAD-dependent oxidoreductase [Micromonospora thermarum]|uniref:FAD-dependent oxidoreductase n=1 Tax=Micromonospora thermarum TaxID=2720024 RepID=A0ABX0ZA76_9ACTN|nr:FAD-dependent oxidoreductase [Micromonospora thermarum]NJP33364.1 FAD-dependent oxidoreductase [Micromonospora thermarum]
MSQRVLVLGGGIAGTAAAIALARRGHPVTVVERDPPPADPTADPFLHWPRRGVPQFRLPHGFSARARNLLLRHAPDVLARLRANGVEEMNLFKRLIPEDQWVAADDTFTNVWARRAVFELALRLTAEEEPGVEFRCPAVVNGLRFDWTSAGPRVASVRLADGDVLTADVVLDCLGQRSPMSRWLAAEGIRVPTEVQDCETVYYSRYFRFTDTCELPRTSVATLRGEFADGWFIGFPGDHDTYAFSFECHPDNRNARALRHTSIWEAVARGIPALAPWVDPANGTPLEGVQVMAGNRSLRRRYVIDGQPVVLGLLSAGDSLCASNPAYGWGSAMALTYAFAAGEAVDVGGGDPVATALAYDAATAREADAVYRESASMDRARIYRITGQPVPDEDKAEMARQDLISAALSGGVLHDLELGRAFNRRVNLVGPADAVLDGTDLVRHAERLRTPA